jgi:hypothetical protein
MSSSPIKSSLIIAKRNTRNDHCYQDLCGMVLRLFFYFTARSRPRLGSLWCRRPICPGLHWWGKNGCWLNEVETQPVDLRANRLGRGGKSPDGAAGPDTTIEQPDHGMPLIDWTGRFAPGQGYSCPSMPILLYCLGLWKDHPLSPRSASHGVSKRCRHEEQSWRRNTRCCRDAFAINPYTSSTTRPSIRAIVLQCLGLSSGLTLSPAR